MRIFSILINFLVLICTVNVVEGQPLSIQFKQKSLSANQVDISPKIDGKLDDAAWKKVTPVSDFIQYEPQNGANPTEMTFVYLCYDKNNLYVAFDCKDSNPDKIIADVAPRGSFGNNDCVAIVIDTYNDKRNAYWFYVNPYGIQEYSFDTLWESKGKINSDGWVAEMAIPFKSLRFSKKIEQLWGINFMRYIKRKDETGYWTYVGRDDNFLEKCGILTGLRNINWGHNLEFFPFLGGRSSEETGKLYEQKTAGGIDIKYGITPNLTMDLSISPDFSEVESDPYFFQLTPYEYYLTERRPFFAEGSQYFDTPVTLFYSRRIKNPMLALKLTGKTGPYSLGIITARDNIEDEPDEYYGLFRLKRDVFKTSSLGIMFTDKEWQNNYGRNASFDVNFTMRNIYTLSGQLATSFNSMGLKGDLAATFDASRFVDNGFLLDFSYEVVSPKFESLTGYTWMTDYKTWLIGGGYGWRLNRIGIRRIDARASLDYSTDYNGMKTSGTSGIAINIRCMKSIFLCLNFHGGRKRAQLIQNEELVWSSNSFPWQNLYFYIGSYQGGLMDASITWAEYFTTFVYQDNFTKVVPGRSRNFGTTLTLRPQKNIRWNAGVNYYLESIKSIGENIFDALTLSTELHYQLSKEWFTRLYVKTETKEDRYRIDTILGYYFKSGSIFYLTYKEEREREIKYRRSYSTVMAKFSYLWRI